MRERLSQKGVFKLRPRPTSFYPGKEEPGKGIQKLPYGYRDQRWENVQWVREKSPTAAGGRGAGNGVGTSGLR